MIYFLLQPYYNKLKAVAMKNFLWGEELIEYENCVYKYAE